VPALGEQHDDALGGEGYDETGTDEDLGVECLLRDHLAQGQLALEVPGHIAEHVIELAAVLAGGDQGDGEVGEGAAEAAERAGEAVSGAHAPGGDAKHMPARLAQRTLLQVAEGLDDGDAGADECGELAEHDCLFAKTDVDGHVFLRGQTDHPWSAGRC